GETRLHILDTHAGDDGHAVPLAQAEMRDLITDLAETFIGELVVLAFGFLHGQHIHVVPDEKIHHPVHACACGVDVPVHDAHALYPSVLLIDAPVRLPSRTPSGCARRSDAGDAR